MCLHTAAGRVGSQLEVGCAGEESPPGRGFRKSKGKKEGKKKPGAAWLEAKPKYSAALVGLVEGKRGDLCCGTGREVCAGPCRTCRRGDLRLGVRV